MSNIKKGSKLTVSTGNGISRASSNNLGVLELSGPGLANVVSQDSTFSLASSNVPQLSIGAIDNSGIFQLGLDNQGNAILEATQNGANNNILIQQLGGYVGIGTDTPASTFHVNSTDALIIPVGTDANRPGESGQITAQNGMIRYNTDTSQFEGYGPGSAWGSLGGVIDVDGDTYILAETSASVDNDDLQFYTDGSERMIIDSSGYVGIGNSNPQTELDISGQITANTKEYTHEIEFNNTFSYDNWILFNSSYGNAGDVPVNTDWTIEYKQKITFAPSSAGDAHFGVVLEEDGISSTAFNNNTYFMYWQSDPSTNLTFRYQPADGTQVNELIPGTGYQWSLFSDHVDVKWEFLTKNNTIRLYFNGENVKTISNISNPSKIFGRWGFGDVNGNTHNIINPRITYGGKTYHLTTQYLTSSTAPTLTTTTKNVELINSTNNQINIPKLHSTELYADKMFVGRNNFNDYTFNAERKLVASDGVASDEFGRSVAIDGDYAIVGARLGDGNVTDSGTAYIYNVHTGAEIHKLTASDGAADDYFGYSVAISGNYAIVSGWGNDTSNSNAGSAYIFNVKTGEQLHRIILDASWGDNFGFSVGIDGNYAIIGSRYDDPITTDSGSAYIINVQTGTQHKKLTPLDGAGSDLFGYGVAISGNYAIVGARDHHTNGVSDSGAAYIFNVQSGAQLYKLTASVPGSGDEFGYNVDIDGDYAIVGALYNDDNGSNSGAAYIFNVQTGEQIYKLTAGDGADDDYFGMSVAISGNYAIVGAFGDDDNGLLSGSAYIFDVQTGMQVKKITASDGAASDYFGYQSVAISGNYAIVGAYQDNSNQGAAYIYGPTASSSYLLNINDDGHIGIGTSEPKTELHVQGAITTDKLYAGTGAPTDYTFSIENKIVAHDGAGGDQFGISIAIDGDYAIVGAYQDHNNGFSDNGAAYIYNVHTGIEIHKLVASDAASNDQFGISVAIDGDYAIVGAWKENANSGAAYIFNVRTGAEIHKLTPLDRAADDYFGNSVAISGNYVIVGSYADQDNGDNSGSAYIFNVQTGTQVNKLTASDGATSDYFGKSVAIDGDYAIVGAHDHHTNGVSDSGAAYIFNVQSGAQLYKLTASVPGSAHEFGFSVAISGNYAVVGERYGDGNVNDSGTAYIFNVQTGTQLHEIISSDGLAWDQFGVSVAISGNYAIVGALGHDQPGTNNNAGTAYIFDVRTGMQVKKILASDGAGSDYFGYSVAISGNYAIVGAYQDNSSQGAAYIYGPNDPPLPLLNVNELGVGIGTSEPKTELHVQGAITTDKLYAGTGAPTDYTFSIENKLLAHDGVASDQFGYSVAIDGDYAIVGARDHHANGLSDSGAAYIYNIHTGAEIHKLTASDAAANDEFGGSVAISGNYAIVTAYKDDSNKGAAYIFNIHTGAEIHKLTASDGAASDYFGKSAGIDGNYAIIGAYYDNSLTGSAYIFNVQTGTQLRKLTDISGVASDYFGYSVAISGNYAIVGSPDHHTNGVSNSGAAYIFNIHTGEQIHKLTAVSGGSGHNFGYSVAIDGNYAVVGENRDSDNGNNSGSAHVFNVQTGELLYKVTASDGEGGDLFGSSVAIDGNYFIVGAYLDNLSGSDEGSAYIFDVRTGAQIKKITASDPVTSHGFGWAIAISNNYVIVGAYQDNSSQGAAYIYGPNDPLPPLLSIDNDSGNVGIGTTEPKSLLDVNGTLQATTLTSTNLKVGRDYSFSDEKKLLASDGAANDQFGVSVAIDGNYAIVGARFDDDDGSLSGSAYIYNVHTGAEIHKLTANDATTNDYFGDSVAISGNYAIVGAYGDDTNRGSAYIFNVQTGTQIHKLTASDGVSYDYFGDSVAISGNYAIVGAYGDDTLSGSAYIYNVHTGAEIHKLTASDGVSYDRFGHSVAISGNYAIVGARLGDGNVSNSGTAYIFNVQTGTELHKLTASDGAASDEFGYSVAISGNYAIVGAHYDDDKGGDSGSAYIFNVQTGTELHKLVASDAAASDRFGFSVAIDGNYAIVGAYLDDDNGSSSGSAYIFNVQTGTQLHKLVASDGAADDNFGISVAISGNYVIVGAYADDDNGSSSGAAYIYGPSSPYLLSIEDGVTDIPNLVTTGLTSGNFNAGRDFSFSDEKKLLASDGAGGDNFGISAAIDGDYAIVGAFRDDSLKGGAYIYNVHTGAEIRKLTASDGVANDYFGKSVDIDGNYAIVGAYGDDSWAGSAYIFDVRTGTQLHKLTENGRAGNEDFGVDVGISGNYAIVGASHDDDNGSNAGAAYIFNVQTGELHRELTPLDRAASDFFGYRVAISGNYAIVGAYQDDDDGSASGSAYVFNVQTGTQLHKLTASDAAAGDRFGVSVAIDGNYAIVGAYYEDANGTDSGSAYIFNLQTGAQLHKITASDGAAGDLFGENLVAISGNYAIVGARKNDDNGTDSGSAYIFDVRTGTQIKKITASDGAAGDYFGFSVAISGNYAIVAAYYDDDNGTDSGSAYIYGPSSPSLLSIDNDSGNMNIVGGNVGIGTTDPEYPLHLQTTIVRNDSGSLGYLPSSGTSGSFSFPQTHIGAQISIKASGSIWSDIYMLVGSDRRIKEKIEEVPDALALQQVRTIPCKYYEYKDKFKKGFGKTIGFIAQEVREILPMAISLQTDFVPDEMRVLTDISWNGTTLYTDISGSSARYRFYVSDDLSGNGAIEKEIMGSGSTGFKFDKQYNFVFCYGKKVNDFHTVDKSKIFALNFAATQELDRIQQQQIIDISNANTTIQTLQTDLSNANTIIQQQATTIQQQATTIQTLETQIADILTRLSNLENTGSS